MPSSYKLSQHDQLDDIMDKIEHGRFHMIAVLGLGCRIIARGSIVSLTTMLEPFFKCKYDLSYFVASLYITLHLICSVLTSPLSGWIADKYGKRKTLILYGSMTVVTSILHVMSNSFLMITTTMASYGIFENGQYLVYPYLLEFLNKSQRKQYSLLLIFLLFGWASGLVLGYLCLKYLSWQWAVIFCIILPVIPAIITLGYMPESPRYLLAAGDINGAVESLVRIVTTNMPNADKQELTSKYTKILHEKIPSDVNLDEHESYLSSHDDDLPSNEGTTSEKVSLLDSGDMSITRKDLWQRIIALCVLGFMASLSRNFLLFAAGQSYKDSSKQQCNQCSTFIQLKQLIFVTLGSSLAIVMSYNLIGHVRRRLAMRCLVMLLAILVLPFYFKVSDWLKFSLLFIASILTESFANLVSLYCNEVVPSSVRGRAYSLMSGCWVAGSIFAAFFATYVLHISLLLTFLFIHFCILTCLFVVYRHVIETKDVSLN